MSLHLTREQAIENHRKMWHWIADATKKYHIKAKKVYYFVFHELPLIRSNCFLCDYCDMVCNNCPLDWGSNSAMPCIDRNTFGDQEGLYSKWRDCYEWQECARLARQIANLPEKEDPVE